MPNRAMIVGIHNVDADESVHMIELEIEGVVDAFDFGEVTQEIPDEEPDNWQVAYDEREAESPNANRRFVFFFHDIDFALPLSTPFGKIDIPDVTKMPDRLSDIEYDAP
jgi:hypothetical protein